PALPRGPPPCFLLHTFGSTRPVVRPRSLPPFFLTAPGGVADPQNPVWSTRENPTETVPAFLTLAIITHDLPPSFPVFFSQPSTASRTSAAIERRVSNEIRRKRACTSSSR